VATFSVDRLWDDFDVMEVQQLVALCYGDGFDSGERSRSRYA
jgi:hypothetical protein